MWGVQVYMEIDPTKAIEIMPGIYWIGWPDENAGFSNNPYLVISGDDVVLFDPGSRLEQHFNWVKQKIESIIPIEKITAIIVHHQDPDLCASIPLFEEIIGVNNFDLITSERTGIFLPYYGVKTDVTYVSDGDVLTFGDKDFVFITSPYLHFPGAIVTYDATDKILFSSDIFGGFSINWSLYANEYYIEAIKAFSQPYFSDKRHVANFLDKIDQLEIDLIAPQHGSLIKRDLIPTVVAMLRNLEVGIWK